MQFVDSAEKLLSDAVVISSVDQKVSWTSEQIENLSSNNFNLEGHVQSYVCNHTG